MNKVILIGRLIKDPDIRTGTNDTKIARYILAVNRKYHKNNEPTADFIGCVALGKNGEFAEKYLYKGMKIAVTGRIQTGSYTNRDGQRVYTTDILIEEQEFAENKKNQPEEQPQPPVPSPEQDTSGFMDMPSIMDDELPFN
nr:MAG TPA: Single strand binding protein [Caudoviricetes sp.]DAP83542.1 MAG TPA: Single strand binding protein [Caudoviricetes sp.]